MGNPGRKSTEQLLAEFRQEILGIVKGVVNPTAALATPVAPKASKPAKAAKASGSRLLFVMESVTPKGVIIPGAVQLTYGNENGQPGSPSPEITEALKQWTETCKANGRQSRGMMPGFGLPGRRYGAEEFLPPLIAQHVAEWRRINKVQHVTLEFVKNYRA